MVGKISRPLDWLRILKTFGKEYSRFMMVYFRKAASQRSPCKF